MNMNKVIWIVGQMCVGKTYYSKIIGEMFGLEPFHLDHIDHTKPLVEAYKEAIKTGLIEGFTPHRNNEHLNAITEALKGKEVYYIQIAPDYVKWLENCRPIIDCPTDENPPSYLKDDYEAENERIKLLTKPMLIIK